MLSKGRRIRGKYTEPPSLQSTVVGLKEIEEDKPFRHHKPSKTIDFANNTLPLEVQQCIPKSVLTKLNESQRTRPQSSRNSKFKDVTTKKVRLLSAGRQSEAHSKQRQMCNQFYKSPIEELSQGNYLSPQPL